MIMPLPFQLLVPTDSWEEQSVSNKYPVNCKYKIGIAKPVLLEMQGAVLSIQSFSGLDYYIELWSFSLLADGYVHLKVHYPIIPMVICLGGSCTMSFDNGNIWSIGGKKYSLCYYPDGLHKISFPKGDNVLLLLVPPVNYLHSMAQEHLAVRELFSAFQFNSEQGMFLQTMSLSHSVFRIIKLLEILREQAASLDHSLRGYMLQLLSLYNKQLRLTERENNLPGASGRKKVEAIIEFIHAHLSDEDLGITTKLAQRFHIRLATLRKQFRQITGKTIQHYIRDKRLEYAHHLLIEEKLPVFDVSVMAGYSATSNFIRAYKKKYGHPPGADK